VKKDVDTGLAALIRRPKGRRTVQYLLVFIGCVLVVDALVGDRGVLQMLKKRQEIQALDQQLAAARAENARLAALAHRLKYDPAAIEELARRDLGLIKRGEKMFIIRDVGPADARPGEK
jgi:cell division protein FtsB